MFWLWLCFDSAVAYLTYCSSTEVNWSFVEGVHRWFPYSFANGRVCDLFEACFRHWRNMWVGRLMWIEDRLLRPLCRKNLLLTSAPWQRLKHTCIHFQGWSTELMVSHAVSPSVPYIYDVELDAEDKWNLSDIRPFDESNDHLSLRADFTVICDKRLYIQLKHRCRLLLSSILRAWLE